MINGIPFKNKLLFLLFIITCSYSFSQSAAGGYSEKMKELKNKLVGNNVPEDWITANFQNKKFKIYQRMPEYFKNMAEKKVDSKEKSFEWYKQFFGLDKRIIKAGEFIDKNIDVLKKIESLNGIHYELIVAILAVETNFADINSRGNFFVFNALVSQYVLMPERENFALKELIALYNFTLKSGKDTYSFIGSFAGACGWGQFLPSSLMKFFRDSPNDDGIDIYSLEDNLYSIENYLYSHNLNGRNIDYRQALYDAIYSYNPDDTYVKGIIYIYDKLRESGK